MARVKRIAIMDRPMPPTQLAALLNEHIAALRVRDYSENTIRNQHLHVRYFLEWCAERGLTEPVEVTRPVLERYQRHLFHQRKRNGEPLSFRSQHAKLVASAVVVPLDDAAESHPPQPGVGAGAAPPGRTVCPAMCSPLRRPSRCCNSRTSHDPIGLRDRAILECCTRPGCGVWRWSASSSTTSTPTAGTILIRQGKGKKDRIVPIGDRAVAWLQKYVREARPQLATEPDDRTLFLTHAGEEINREC